MKLLSEKVIIIGGGPVGMFLALTLSNDLFKNIIILEKRSLPYKRNQIVILNQLFFIVADFNSIHNKLVRKIIEELEKPGRDPRQIIKVFSFDPNVRKIEDLQTGMVLPGIITNITKFGAFVDIGIKENGLIHISNLKDGFVSDPADVVHLNQQLQVKVIDIDIPRKRIQLSLKYV